MSKKKIKNRRNDYERSNMYMFHNERYDIQFFTHADRWNEAMMKFDLADFSNRDDWKIYVACGQQPTGGKNVR